MNSKVSNVLIAAMLINGMCGGEHMNMCQDGVFDDILRNDSGRDENERQDATKDKSDNALPETGSVCDVEM